MTSRDNQTPYVIALAFIFVIVVALWLLGFLAFLLTLVFIFLGLCSIIFGLIDEEYNWTERLAFLLFALLSFGLAIWCFNASSSLLAQSNWWSSLYYNATHFETWIRK